MNRTLTFLAVAVLLLPMSTVDAQRPRRGGQAGGPRGGGAPPPNRDQAELGGPQNQRMGLNQADRGFGNPNFLNQNVNQNMPSIAELAQRMIANFDADGSGELSQAELQGALSMLRNLMQNQMAGQQQNGFANQQNGIANLQNGIGNQRNRIQRGQNLQENQAFGNRPPRGRGGGR